MFLKPYQERAIDDLEDFLRRLNEKNSISAAFEEFWSARGARAEKKYQNNIAGVPRICFKVPTGGGKTFMATASLKVIFDAMPATQSKVVVWLVPSETILTQTYKNLSNPAHPYRRRLAADFGRVEIYTKEQLLFGENFSPAEVAVQLSILVLSYDSFRTANKDGRKAYQQNGYLEKFLPHLFSDEKILAGADKISLIQVIRHFSPVMIVDESHHATTPLSVDMLKNFNPSFILELTATPQPTSNIISRVPAYELKAEGMVKLPVCVINRRTQEDVIIEAIIFRKRLEEIAQAEKIRPIVLFQAEPQGAGDRSTFDKIKNELIATHKIPAEQIAIKTANINELKNVDLMAADCPIRYIITINALKEGWDCPFAYILASLANRTAEIDVEQILGRILRRPFTKNFSNDLLNMSYVFTSSADFKQTLDKVVTGLNAAGFSEQEYRASCDELSIDDMERQVQQENKDYQAGGGEIMPAIDFPMRECFKDAQEIFLPEFCRRNGTRIQPENFRTNFSLRDKDIDINFDGLEYEVAAIDIQEKENAPRYNYFSMQKMQAFLEYFDELTDEGKIRQCRDKIVAIIDKNTDALSSQEISAYVMKIVSAFDKKQIRDAMIHTKLYADKIKDKIDAMIDDYAKKTFFEQIDARKIFATPSYKFPATISLTNYQENWTNSLYAAEDSVNKLELKVAAALSSQENVLWWHRNISKKGFCLNGFTNHYPDFIARMKSGFILLIEAKGDDRDNSDSKRKLELGKLWQDKAGSDKFGYFMVFDKNNFDGTLSFDKFVSTLKNL